MRHKIGILLDHHSHSAQVAKMAAELDIPIIETNQIETSELLLKFVDDKLTLQLIATDAPGPIYADFLAGKLAHRRLYGGGKSQLLARAIGLQKMKAPTVLDVTAGLGQDGFVLACLGCQVTMVERSPIIAALVEDALNRARHDTSFQNLSLCLVLADSANFLQQLDHANYPDVIYLDPMFPSRSKSALVKKEMRILRAVVGDDIDADNLFNLARKIAKKRVVVKRSRHAPLLANAQPTLQFKGQSSRFDVYIQ